MPRYVAKEDVEKGLVDPKRPLEEQPEYKQKIEEQEHKKQKQQERKNTQQRPRKARPPRNQRPKFNWNKNQITLQTKIPQKPKKLLERPDSVRYREGLQKLKAERQALKLQKNAIFDEQRAVLRDLTQNKKHGREAITQYSGAMKDKFTLNNQLRKEIRSLDDHKKKINSQIEHLNSKINALSKPTDSQDYSIQFLQYEIDCKEHQLMTANINKREETKLSNQINDLKRALNKARPQIQIQSQLNKLQDQINILYRQVKPIKHELHIKITEANSIQAELDALKVQRKTEEGQVKVQRTPEDIRAEYDIKLKALQERKDKLEDKIDDYVDKFVRENDEYEDQQDLLKYIAWVEGEIAWLKKRKQDDEKRKKEKEEWEKKKLKQKQQYQKRQQERKKNDEQRKAREQERKKKLVQERERFINRNPNHELIDLCQSLIAYCQHLKPNSTYKYEDSRIKQAGQLNFGKEWQKEIKGGAQVIVSKKTKLDEQQKKPVKAKKKQQKQQDENFAHGIEIVNQFQAINLLPPVNSAQIDSTIKLIKDKIAFYNNPTEQERAAFREKATKEFEERHAPRDRHQYKDHKQFKEKKEEETGQPTKEKKPAPRKQKKELRDQDFPDLK